MPSGLNRHGQSLTPLYPDLHKGLIAVTVLAFISFLASLALFGYLTVKLVKWYLIVAKTPVEHDSVALDSVDSGPTSQQADDFKLGIDGIFSDNASSAGGGGSSTARRQRRCRGAPNQSLLLIYNLVLADLLQATAFSLNASWLFRNGIIVGTGTCFTQGLLVSIGDLASSVFITAVAIHAYLSIIKQYQPKQRTLYMTIALLWSFVILISTLPIAVTRNGAENGGYFVRAVAWCWVNEQYQTLRLATHYAYVFLGLFTTSVVYSTIYFKLRYRNSRQAKTYTADGPVTTTQNSYAFLIYPIIYVTCTLPIAIGRIISMTGARVPVEYFCFAGAMIAFNGFFDCLLYTTTRNSIIFSSVREMDMKDTGLSTFTFLTPPARQFGNVISVETAKRKKRRDENGKKKANAWQFLDDQAEFGYAPQNSIHMDFITSVVIERQQASLGRS